MVHIYIYLSFNKFFKWDALIKSKQNQVSGFSNRQNSIHIHPGLNQIPKIESIKFFFFIIKSIDQVFFRAYCLLSNILYIYNFIKIICFCKGWKAVIYNKFIINVKSTFQALSFISFIIFFFSFSFYFLKNISRQGSPFRVFFSFLLFSLFF